MSDAIALDTATSPDIHNTPVRNCDTPGETALSCSGTRARSDRVGVPDPEPCRSPCEAVVATTIGSERLSARRATPGFSSRPHSAFHNRPLAITRTPERGLLRSSRSSPRSPQDRPASGSPREVGGKSRRILSRLRAARSTVFECYQRRRKCATVTPECSRTQQRRTQAAQQTRSPHDHAVQRHEACRLRAHLIVEGVATLRDQSCRHLCGAYEEQTPCRHGAPRDGLREHLQRAWVAYRVALIGGIAKIGGAARARLHTQTRSARTRRS
jgi:hypothetical protein